MTLVLLTNSTQELKFLVENLKFDMMKAQMKLLLLRPQKLHNLCLKKYNGVFYPSMKVAARIYAREC